MKLPLGWNPPPYTPCGSQCVTVGTESVGCTVSAAAPAGATMVPLLLEGGTSIVEQVPLELLDGNNGMEGTCGVGSVLSVLISGAGVLL